MSPAGQRPYRERKTAGPRCEGEHDLPATRCPIWQTRSRKVLKNKFVLREQFRAAFFALKDYFIEAKIATSVSGHISTIFVKKIASGPFSNFNKSSSPVFVTFLELGLISSKILPLRMLRHIRPVYQCCKSVEHAGWRLLSNRGQFSFLISFY